MSLFQPNSLRAEILTQEIRQLDISKKSRQLSRLAYSGKSFDLYYSITYEEGRKLNVAYRADKPPGAFTGTDLRHNSELEFQDQQQQLARPSLRSEKEFTDEFHASYTGHKSQISNSECILQRHVLVNR